MLVVFTGHGKGKTTAALGQALRAVGAGRRVLMVQFIKGPWKSGEDTSYLRLAPDLQIVKTGKGFVGILGDTLPLAEHQAAAAAGLQYAHEEAAAKKWDIIILDEIWNALSLGLLTPAAIQEFIDSHISVIDHLILTGRDCPPEFIRQAGLVTEMREVKHPFQDGVLGKKGLEY